MDKKSKLVCITGLVGSGKTTAANFFVKKGYHYLRFGQVVLDIVKKRVGITSDPALEQKIREELREKQGMAAMAILNKPRIDALLKKGNVIGDGLYSWAEYKFLKQTYGERFKVISIFASPLTRYARLLERTKIDSNMINRPLTLSEAQARDYAEIEHIEKGGTIAMADTTIINEGSISDFEDELSSLFSKKDVSRPSWDEYFMSMAIFASTRSTCRHVRAGAVIVLDKRIIGTGYNGAPPGIVKNCLEAGCHKERSGIKYKEAFNVGKCIGVHAEINALANLSIDIHKGATLYITIFPCPSCAKTLLAYNISRVVYKSQYHKEESKLSVALFAEAGVVVEQLNISKKRLSSILFNREKVDFDVF